MPDRPPGFFLGRYPLRDNEEPAWYGLYIPPEFRRRPGPFPLLVFFHGYGERKKDNFFSAGLAEAIRRKIAQGEKFDFVAFFPRAPEGRWSADELDVALEILDHVVRKHNIDPDRIILTGHSTGAHAVWTAAAQYPEKWAAIVSLCSFDSPDVERVKKVPCWFFQGDNDHYIPVTKARQDFEAYQEAGGEARFTVIPKGTHIIWPQVYGNNELFVWLADKKRT